jgi:hypothetical protein
MQPSLDAEARHGIRENIVQFSHQLIQVLLVGFAIGIRCCWSASPSA